MRIKMTITGRENIRDIERGARRMADKTWLSEANRALIDAGRKTRNKVAKAVKKQGNFRTYSDVNRHVRGVGSELQFTISAARGGQRLEHYAGLRVSRSQKADPAVGTVRSGVWNNPRTFARSFATERGTFALLPDGEGSSTVAPRALWTFGAKKDQPRGAGGRFESRGITYPGVERLFGPSIAKEVGKDESLETFHREAPAELRIAIGRRAGKIFKI